AGEAGVAPRDRERLRELGEAINYNAYGECESDVRIAPARLYEKLVRHRHPLHFADAEPIAAELVEARAADLAQALQVTPYWSGEAGSVLILPDAPWSRRVIGSAANEWAQAEPSRAWAVLRDRGDGTLVASVLSLPEAPWSRRVIGSAASEWARSEPSRAWAVLRDRGDGTLVASVRAPLAAPSGAGALCARFGGSGRKAAAGIDRLAADDLDRFVREFASMRWGGASTGADGASENAP